MTASDPRVGEIQARLAAASEGPWEIIGGNEYLTGIDVCIGLWDEGGIGLNDAEFIAAAPADVAYLLAELADRDEKLAKVEALTKYLHGLADGDKHYAALIRAAVAAANGGGE